MYNNQPQHNNQPQGQAKAPYQHKPGRGSFFTNDKKRGPQDPAFTGSAKLPDGTDVWVNVWVELDQGGYPKANGQHSVSIKPKDAPSGYAGNPAPAAQPAGYPPQQAPQY